MLSGVTSSLIQRIEETGAVIESGGLPRIRANRAQLSRLLQNLLSNSLQYCTPGKPLLIQISARLEGDLWTIAVSDNGMGFDPVKAESVFEIFQRLHYGDSGTGIGLAICKRIVENHGGTIWAESEPGIGTSIHFTLPAGSQASAAGGSQDS